MSEAPNRIWAWSMTPEWKTAWDVDDAEAPPHAAPYIRADIHRADLVEAAVKRAIEACAEKTALMQMRIPNDPRLAYHAALEAIDGHIRAIAQDPEAIAKIIGDA